MRISDVTMEKLLVRSGVATAEQIEALKEEASTLKKPIQDLAIQNELIDDKTLAKAFADYTQIPYIELNPSDISLEALNNIPERTARQYNAILFKIDENGTNHIAMDDPDDVQAVNFLQKLVGINT